MSWQKSVIVELCGILCIFFLTTYVNIHVEIVCLKQQVSCCIPFYRISGLPSLSCPLAFLSHAMFALQCYHEAVCFLLVAQYFVVIAVLHANAWKRLFPPVKEGVGEQALLSNVVLDLIGCQGKILFCITVVCAGFL